MKNQETQKGEEGIRVDGVTPELLTGLTFFANRLCPYANRAYWALQEKGLLKDGSVKYVHVELFGNKPAWYKVRESHRVPRPCSCSSPAGFRFKAIQDENFYVQVCYFRVIPASDEGYRGDRGIIAGWE